MANPAGPELARKRRRTCAVADDFYFFRLFVDVLKISIVDALFAQSGKEKHCQRSVQIAERRGAVAVFEHHALRETCRRVIIAQPGKRLDSVKVKFLGLRSSSFSAR